MVAVADQEEPVDSLEDFLQTWGSGFRVQGLGSKDLGFRAYGSGCRV